jgi:hypothetical protein
LVKNIVPKLEAALLHIPINPLNQVPVPYSTVP